MPKPADPSVARKHRPGGMPLGKDKKKKKKSKKGGGPQPPPHPDELPEDELVVSDEDIEFVKQNLREVGFLTGLDKDALADKVHKDRPAPRKRKAREEDEEEADYELAPRQPAGWRDGKGGKAAAAGGDLPTKTLEGQVVFEPRAGRAASKATERAIKAAVEKRGLDVDLGSDSEPEDGGVPGSEGGSGSEDGDSSEEEDDDDGKNRPERNLAKRERRVALKAQRREQKKVDAQAAAAAREIKSVARAEGGAATSVDVPPEVAELERFSNKMERREAAKERMAAAATQLLANPEENVGQLKGLLALAGDADDVVAKLSMLSLLAVFKDICPGYRIRLPTEKELEVKVTKEVRALREYEAALLKGYQSYLRLILHAAQGVARGTGTPQRALAGVKCLCGLLESLPHFNYRKDVLSAVVPRTSYEDPRIRSLCQAAVGTLLKEASAGSGAALDALTEAVELIAELVKKKKCMCHPGVLRQLLNIRYNQALLRGGPRDGKKGGAPPPPAQKKRRGVGPVGPTAEELAAKRDEARARAKEVKADFREAEAVLPEVERRKLQSQALQVMMECYFRVLKHAAHNLRGSDGGDEGSDSDSDSDDEAPGWGAAVGGEAFPLLDPALEGLSKFAHLINIDFHGDLMDVLREVLTSGALARPLAFRCLLCVCDITSGAGEALNVDLGEFHAHLYQLLLQMPLVGGGIGARHDDEDEDGGGGASGRGAGALRDDAEEGGDDEAAGAKEHILLVKVLQRMLIESKRAHDQPRMAAFAKRLASVAMFAPDPGAALGLIAVARRLMQRHTRCRGMLEGEGGGAVGGQRFRPDASDPGDAGALAAVMWELIPLSRHWHPQVAQSAAAMAAMFPEAGGINPPPEGASKPDEISALFSTARGGFRPPPKTPKALKSDRKRRREVALPSGVFRSEVALAGLAPDDEFWQEAGAEIGAGGKAKGSKKAGAGGKGGKGAAEAAAVGAGTEGAEETYVGDDGIELRTYFRGLRRFKEYKGLLREKARLARMLGSMREHLAAKRKAGGGDGGGAQKKKKKGGGKGKA